MHYSTLCVAESIIPYYIVCIIYDIHVYPLSVSVSIAFGHYPLNVHVCFHLFTVDAPCIDIVYAC